MSAKFTAGLGAALLLTPALASARPFRVMDVPSAPNGCMTCHTTPMGGPRNVFGQQVAMNLEAGDPPMAHVDWAALCPQDADGDGASNGIELGDTDCSWQTGDNPVAAVSDPADVNDAPSNMPDAGVGPDAGSPASDAGMSQDPIDDEGGCDAAGFNGGASSAWLLAGIGILLRRRRSRTQGGRID